MLSAVDTPERELIPAFWPDGNELSHQLQLVPYIRIPGEFDHQTCFKEAERLLPWFVENRDDVLSEKTGTRWKSLALRALSGDSRKTLTSAYYPAEAQSSFQMTDVAEICPNTISFLKRITDFERCERIRFVLLEPGARIVVHADSGHLDVRPSINIALNMPDGCKFVIDSNPDGSHHRFTTQLPFLAGDVMVINTASYHYVINDSDQPRIHIKMNAPVRFTYEELLQRARLQNGVSSEREVIHKLIEKYALQGKDLVSRSTHAQKAQVSATLPKRIRIVLVDDEDIQDSRLRQDCLENISAASLFPLRHEVVKASQLDRWIQGLIFDECEFVVLVPSGTYIRDILLFSVELNKACKKLANSTHVFMSHIAGWHPIPNFDPDLHEQLTILHLSRWREAGLAVFRFQRSRLFSGFQPLPLTLKEKVRYVYPKLALQPSGHG